MILRQIDLLSLLLSCYIYIMTREIVHALALVFTIVLSFLFPKTGLAEYDLQITAFLFIVLYLIKKFFITQKSNSQLIESVIFTMIIISIVATTGNTSSPFFFLIYFLLFSLSLLLEPVISVTTSITLIILFLFTTPQGQSIKDLLPILSLAFIAPFAMFLGQAHTEAQRSKIKNQELQKDSMLFITLLVRNHLKNIKDAVDNFVGDNELDIIRKSVNRMEKLIEKYKNKD